MSAYAQTSSDHTNHGTITASWDIGYPTASAVTATLYSDGCFVVSGTGDVEAYEYTYVSYVGGASTAPWWSDYRNDILSVTFEEGVTPTSLAYWFYDCSNLTEISALPDSVIDMTSTFSGYTSFVEAPEIPEGVTNLSFTFAGCSSLVKAPVIPEGVTSLYYTFTNCTSLVEAGEISEGVTNMEGTFSNCWSLVKAPEIPSSVVNMRFAFYYCWSLKVAPEIPEGVEDMNSAFIMCSLLEAPLIPSTVTDMSWAFADCMSLTSLPDGFSFPEGANTEGAFGTYFGMILDESIVTYCSADDYEALLAAYDWSAGWEEYLGFGFPLRTLVARSDYEGSTITYEGNDRYETAKLIVDQELALAEELDITFEGIIVANGDDSHFADALAASGLSGLLNYPIVLTSDSSLSSYAQSVISQIAAAAEGGLKIIVLGDDNSISQTARTQLREYAYGDLVELQGDNRYETAQEIYDYGSEAANWNTEYTIITTGEKFPDALSIASYAAYANARVILVNGTLGSLPASTAAEIAGSENIIILGDANAVSEGIENELKGIVGEDKVTRLQGENRYETSAAVAAWALGQGMTLEGAGFATGEKSADALASSSLLGMTGSVLLLVSPTSSNNTAALELLEANADDVSTINIFGDTNSVSTTTRNSITSALGWGLG